MEQEPKNSAPQAQSLGEKARIAWDKSKFPLSLLLWTCAFLWVLEKFNVHTVISEKGAGLVAFLFSTAIHLLGTEITFRIRCAKANAKRR